MKKSELRKLIRESIKELVFEQDRGKTNYSGTDGRSGVTLIPPKSRELQIKEQGNTPCTNGAYMMLEACPNSYHWTGNYNAGPWHCHCCTIDGNTPTQADVDTTIDFGPLNTSHGPNSFKVLTVNPGHPSDFQGSMNSTSACCVPAVQAGQGGCITPPSSCDQSAWPNYSNWTSTFTNTVTNHPNPCNFLNIKIAQFTSQIPNVGPVWANQLQCKLDLANQLHTQNNC